ncbi:MAG TPA: hypothetical protein VMY87_05935 [Armatimonadota bacterium]|nr:hypothetical protein [Armatimonadota bacterium]
MASTKQNDLVEDPLLEHRPRVHSYPAGTWGPKAAAALISEGAWHEQPRQT